jgi:hypothetical protein
VPIDCRTLALGALFALAAGCASAPAPEESSLGGEPEVPALNAPREYLDEQTGATVTTVDKALIFARDRSERAANLRDYVTVVPASVNRGGKRAYVLIAYIWSTLDPRFEPATPSADALVLVADDRRIRLNANGESPADLGIARPVLAPPGQVVKPLVFPTDLDTLRFIAAARSLDVQTTLADVVVNYQLWEDQRSKLDQFVRYLNGER